MNLGATLYVKNSVEAVDFYCDAFGMTLGYHAKNSDGSFLHAELLRGRESIFAVSENADEEIARSMLAAKQPTMSYGLNLDNDDELKHAYEVLAAGGHILRELGSLPWTPCAADVVDKYGICWYIYVSQHRPGSRIPTP
ncbi:MAG TPA: VOC family protein [Anaerolineaceae bacterium]|nr:VOC family protein [Anaerolineaceae bacterium]HPN50973.1 VOC family protein [Anaerolineaceae bacterium]